MSTLVHRNFRSPTSPSPNLVVPFGASDRLRTTATCLALCAAFSSLSTWARAQSVVVGWGDQIFDSSWNEEPFAKIAAGGYHTFAQRSDGTVVIWGSNSIGQCQLPVPPVGLTYVAMDGGQGHSVALRSDARLIAVGSNNFGQCNVPTPPAGVTYVEVTAGVKHTVARLSDGQVVVWGFNQSGQSNVPPLPPGVS